MSKYPKPATRQNISKIKEQIDYPIYEIIKNNETSGIIIFSYLKNEMKNIPVLISSYDIINEKYLLNKKRINISLNRSKNLTIELGKFKYMNKKYGISIIEIKSDLCDKINFIQLDDSLFEENSELFYQGETIYIIHYDHNKEKSVSFGVINDLNDSNIVIFGNLSKKSIGAPVFSLSKNKLIGIYKESSNYYNKGIILKFIINEFLQEYNKSLIASKNEDNCINEINILVNIETEDINKNIYFLDNYKSETENEEKHLHNNLNELNESNTELYINNNKKIYRKYFRPEIEGKYTIKLIFNSYITDCSYMFAGCENIININFISFDTKYITNMEYMFYKCTNITNLNLFSFDTRNVIDMKYMFYRCQKIKYLDMSSFNTENVRDMSYMFYCCKNLEDINISYFNAKNIQNLDYMFFDCWKLNNINSSLFNIPHVSKNRIFDNRWDLKKDNLNNNNKNEEAINNNANNKEEKNEINILINVEKEDINKKIKFIRDYLNETKAELYINNKKL